MAVAAMTADLAEAASLHSQIGVNYGSFLASTPLSYSAAVDLMKKTSFSKVGSKCSAFRVCQKR